MCPNFWTPLTRAVARRETTYMVVEYLHMGQRGRKGGREGIEDVFGQDRNSQQLNKTKPVKIPLWIRMGSRRPHL